MALTTGRDLAPINPLHSLLFTSLFTLNTVLLLTRQLPRTWNLYQLNRDIFFDFLKKLIGTKKI